MTDFSTIPVRLNDVAITASWFNTIRTKLIESTDAPAFTVYANDAAFVTAKGSVAATGDYYYNSTVNGVKFFDGSVWIEIADTSTVQTITNKVIDADNNTISNLAHGAEVDNPTSGVHGATGSIVGTTDNQTLTTKTIDGNSNTLTVLAASQLSGATPIANGGSGQTTQQAAIDALSNVSAATNEYVLTKDTATGNAVFKAPAAGAITNPTIQKFTTGSGTYTTPANVTYIKIKMAGGGGGGAGSGNGAATAGVAGSNTTFGTSLLIANGGAGGATSGAGSIGGGGSLGSGPIGVVVIGGFGGGYMALTGGVGAGIHHVGGHGGNTPYFSGGGSSASGGAAAQNATTNSGGGGAGGGTGGVADVDTGCGGGSGGFIDAIIHSPSATYSYVVGAGGGGGALGTSGYSGSNGAAGIIIVEEYYN